MRASRLCVVFALLALGLPAFAEPKAYELVKYRGKAAGLTIAFDFGDGYPEASEIRITPEGGGGSRKLVLDQSGGMRFVLEKNRGSGEEVILKMSPGDAPPRKVEGTYRAGGQVTRFTLVKR